MGKFKIGDKVIVAAHKDEMERPSISCSKDLFNLVGTICGVHSTNWTDGSMSYKVAFEKEIGGHNCCGACKEGCGQYINEKYLKLCDEKKSKYLKLYNEKKSEDKIMQKKEYEKKPLEQQIKEKYESKRNVLNARIGFTGGHEQTLVPKKSLSRFNNEYNCN